MNITKINRSFIRCL